MIDERRSLSRLCLAAFAMGLLSTGIGCAGFVMVDLRWLQVYYAAALATLLVGSAALVLFRRKPAQLSGRGWARSGMILPAVLFGGIVLFAPLCTYVSEAALRGAAHVNLKQVALAMHSYQGEHGHLPAAAIADSNGKPLLSWRVAILPFIEEEALYREFKLNEAWDSPHNIQLLQRVPRAYRPPPLHGNTAPHGMTYLQVLVGPGTAFEPGKRLHLPGGFPDGTSNTILVVEAGHPVPWTKPDDLTYDPDGPVPKLGGVFRGAGQFPWRRVRDNYMNAALADASVKVISLDRISEQTLRRAIIRNDGRDLGPDW